jgi:hypothetical protein
MISVCVEDGTSKLTGSQRLLAPYRLPGSWANPQAAEGHDRSVSSRLSVMETGKKERVRINKTGPVANGFT